MTHTDWSLCPQARGRTARAARVQLGGLGRQPGAGGSAAHQPVGGPHPAVRGAGVRHARHGGGGAAGAHQPRYVTPAFSQFRFVLVRVRAEMYLVLMGKFVSFAELLVEKERFISRALDEKQQLVAQMLNVPLLDFHHVAEVSAVSSEQVALFVNLCVCAFDHHMRTVCERVGCRDLDAVWLLRRWLRRWRVRRRRGSCCSPPSTRRRASRRCSTRPSRRRRRRPAARRPATRSTATVSTRLRSRLVAFAFSQDKFRVSWNSRRA